MNNPRPAVMSPAPWAFPKPQTVQLDNGLAIQVFHRPGQYVVSATLSLELPLSLEGANEGVALLTARSLDEGTPIFPGTALSEAIEDVGAQLSVSVTSTSTEINMDVPGSRLDEALSLLAQLVITPTLTEDDVARQISIRLAELDQIYANGSQRATLEFRRALIAADCRLARPPGGLADSIRIIEPEDIRKFHADNYRPAICTLILAGDFASDPIAAVEKAFADWCGRESQPQHLEVKPAPKCALIFDRPDAVQADLRLGRLTQCRTSPRWADLQVASYAMGGAFLSRLNRELRENRGLTYGVSMGINPFRTFGIGTIQGSFRVDAIAESLTIITQKLNLDDSPFSSNEVQQAKDYFVGVTPLRYASAAGIVDQVATLISAGLSTDFIDQNLADLTDVTWQSATLAATVEFNIDPMTLVIVGPANSLANELADIGWPVQVLPY